MASGTSGRDHQHMVVRAARDDDRSRILDLNAAVFGENHARRVDKLWNWQWHDNPALDRPGLVGAVCEWRERLIGSVGFLPANLHRHGEAVASSWAVDAAVHHGWMRQALKSEREASRKANLQPTTRRSSIAADLLNHPLSGPLNLGKMVSRQMQVVAYKVGYRVVPGSGFYWRNISFTARLSRRLGRVIGPSLAWAVDRAACRLPAAIDDVSVFSGDPDQSFDQLWLAAAPDYPFLALRDSQTLIWRYRRHPNNRYTILVDRTQGELRGYAVFTVLKRHGLPQGRVVDLLTRRGDAEACRRLLTGALLELRRQGVDRVDCYMGDATLTQPLEAIGMRRREKFVPLVVRGTDTSEAFYVMAGDGDGS